jgi:aconitate hydratase
VVIAAITSCTNTSNPAVMIGAGLVAKKAAELGLQRQPWVKTSLAPGSKVVTDYLEHAGLMPYLAQLGFDLVGYGCTTCIGNSGPLPPSVSAAIHEGDLVAAAVLSGNRNFEGRINPTYARTTWRRRRWWWPTPLPGAWTSTRTTSPLARAATAQRVPEGHLADGRDRDGHAGVVQPEMFQRQYASVFEGDDRWRALPTPDSELFAWQDDSTYVKNPPYFDDMTTEPGAVQDVRGARVLALLGDSITTDHISPAGAIKADSPAGAYLREHGVAPKDFNSYGARRGNHEIMMRGTFANIRLRNRLNPGVEGGMTTYLPGDEVMSIYDASMKYQQAGVPLIVIAGKEYGTGSSRDWAAKGPRLLGVSAVIAESYERIHRSNLIGMGVLPLQFRDGEGYESLGLTGRETFDIQGLEAALSGTSLKEKMVGVTARADDGRTTEFRALARLDTPQEREYFRHGGILHYVLRQLLAGKE